jgi:hypothetical protein
MTHCPNCGGGLKIVAAILEAPVIEKILMHLGFARPMDAAWRQGITRQRHPRKTIFSGAVNP